MRNRKKWIIAIVLLFTGGVLYAWRRYISYNCCMPQPVIVRGGLCTCDSVMEPAKIVYVMKGGTHVIIRVAVTRSGGWADTLQLNREPLYKLLTLQEYEASCIREGDSIACKHLTIVRGDCSPDVFYFDWKKFASPQANKTKKQALVH